MKKRMLSSMIITASLTVMCGGLFVNSGEGDPVGSLSVCAVTSVSYIDENGVSQTVDNYTPVTSQTVWSSGIYAASGVTKIASTVTVSGNAVLILDDNCDLTVIGGINVSSGSSLKIYACSCAENMGRLTADASDTAFQAGIGSGRNASDAGTVIICGGNIVSKGGRNAAGIGGGANSSGGTVTINGGTITSVPGKYGAAVGGGYNGSGGRITINGGRITADSRFTSKGEENVDSAGIGGGFAGLSGQIEINGGYITAKAAFTDLVFIKPDDIGNSAAANLLGFMSFVTINGGHINENEYYYTVIIPEEITVGDEIEVRAENVYIPSDKKLDVRFRSASQSGRFEMCSPAGDKLEYTVKNNSGEAFDCGDVVLSILGSYNQGSSTIITSLVDKPYYSGVYTDRLIFTVSVE